MFGILWTVVFYSIPLVATFAVIYKITKLERFKKDDEHDIVVTEFDVPKKLTPAEAGAIFDLRVTGRDITAELIHLAIKGYISISKIKTNGVEDFVFTLLKDPESGIISFERDLLKHIFLPLKQVNLSSLKYNFFSEADDINYKVWDSVVQKGYASIRPIDYYIKYGGTGMTLGIFGVLILSDGRLLLACAYFLCALIILSFVKFLQPLNSKGLEMKKYLRGLKKYFEVAERDRMLFFSSPNLESFEFDPLVPYAIALGVIPEWANVFGTMYQVDDKKTRKFN